MWAHRNKAFVKSLCHFQHPVTCWVHKTKRKHKTRQGKFKIELKGRADKTKKEEEEEEAAAAAAASAMAWVHPSNCQRVGKLL